jgi:hypothetical protein
MARAKLEEILGPATIVVRSGGKWTDPATGEVQDKLHLHWRLRIPARGDDLPVLKQARDLAARLVGGDPSNKPVCHPIRWPGSWHRKSNPVLCSIDTAIPDREIDLTTAIAALTAAAPAEQPRPKANGKDHSGEAADWASHVHNVIAGDSYHGALVPLAAKMLVAGMSDGAAVNLLRAIMDNSVGPRDERWNARYADIPRAVKTAREKFGTPSEPQAPPDLATAFTFLGDAPPAPPRELIRKLLPADGVAVTGGQSSAGKTFIIIHKAICLATMRQYFGHKIVERVGTAFIAAEGRALIPNRFAAALAKEQITEKLPIAWLKQLPDFTSVDGIKHFIRQLKASLESNTKCND